MPAATVARRTGRRFYAFAILVYLSVVAALVALALFGRSSSERLGDARVAVHYAALPLFARVVDRATVSYEGLRLSFSGSTPIAFSSGGEPARLREMRSHGEGIDIFFERDVRLELRRSGDESLSLAFAGGALESLSLSVPLRVPGGLAPLGEVPLVSWKRAGRSYYLSLPPGSQVDIATGTLVLSLPPGSRELRFGPATGDGEELSARWLSDQAALVDEQGFHAARDAFLSEAWQGWTKGRLSSDGTLWRDAGGRYVFNEEVGPALLAEALARGEYPARRVLVSAALDRQLRQSPNTVQSAAASVFVGSLREHARRVQAGEESGIGQVRTLLADRDPALFRVPGLIPFVLDHGPYNLVPEIVALAGTLGAGSLEPVAALGVLEVYLDYDAYAASGGTMAGRAREVARKRLVPSLRKTGQGLFLETAAGSVDTAASLRCGSLLLRAGSTLADAQLAAIGRTLVASAVALARTSGFLPGTLMIAGDTASVVEGTEGAIAPETVYRFVAVDRHLPREIPLHLGVGPGTWVWTAADLLSASGESAGLRLTLSFPSGQSQYLIVGGVRSVTQLTLHGVAWRPAADYAQHADGWAYDSAGQFLFIKLTGKAEQEEISVRY